MISDQVLDILNQCTIKDNLLRLPPTQLDRKLYQDVNEVLSRLGGKWKGGKVKAHVFDESLHIEELIGSVIDSKQMPEKNVLAYFRTPNELADRMVSMLEIEVSNPTILEPSAGDGSLCDAVKRAYSNAEITAFELDVNCAKVLRNKGYQVVEEDFTKQHQIGTVNAVVMNPPFSVKGDALAYITHIVEAFKWVRNGGQLIAIAPPGFTFRQDNRSKAFSYFVEQNGGYEELPEATFKESGTNIRTVLINLKR